MVYFNYFLMFLNGIPLLFRALVCFSLVPGGCYERDVQTGDLVQSYRCRDLREDDLLGNTEGVVTTTIKGCR